MNLRFIKCQSASVALGLLVAFGAGAKTGAPHTIVANSSFTNVQLQWAAPSDGKELRWHDGRDYNGDTSTSTDRQKSTKTYVASKFDEDDLRNYVGDKIEAITFFQYRPVVKVTVMVYENGEPVSSAEADAALYSKNTTLKVALPEAVEIKEGTEYMFVVCFEAGNNMDFVAIKDASSNAPGKGDLMSSDGVTWFSTGAGEYLITANLANDTDEVPQGYNVYRNGDQVNSELIADKAFSLENEPEGMQQYTVGAVYEGEEIKSKGVDINLIAASSVLPSPNIVSSSVDGLNVALAWAKPLLGGGELTWSDKSDGISIGGTASSNTKVWVRNNFDASDLLAFRGGSISAINYKFKEAVISGVTLFITKDGVISYSEVVPAEKIAEITAGEWTKFPLATAYKLEDGHSYGYGLYVLHTPKAHPMGVDGCTTIDVKGNSFSTSSPNSKDFNASKPSWKTLKSGGMEGNWLMTADIEGAPAPIASPVYDVYRDGALIKEGLDAFECNDVVENLGTYVYSVLARVDGKSSFGAEKKINVKLPAAYSAPLIENYSFDNETKQLDIIWNMDKEISHCGEPTYKVGFDEEMPLMWGSQFSASELAAYKGYSMSKIKFCIGEEIGDVTIGVYTSKGKAISTIDIPAGTITPQSVYTIKLPEAVEITGEEDLIIAYSGTLPAQSSPIILDDGPLVDGGAKISLTNGLNWLNLSTLNPAYAKYNIFISAMASEKVGGATEASAKVVELGRFDPKSVRIAKPLEYGVVSDGDCASRRAVVKSSEAPSVKEFNIYCNGKLIDKVTGYQYSEKVTRYAGMDYYVTTVFTNGWESAPSETMSFTNRIAQKSVAPFGLTAEYADESLKLEWQAPENSTVLTYVPADAELKALKMTGSSEITSYCVSRFPVSELEDQVGKLISHVQFGVGSTEINSCAVIVVIGENIVYTQNVPVSTLVSGVNDVRLNEPFEIPANAEVGVGFIIGYTSATPHPLGCFECEGHEGFGDLISSSASSGFWYTLHSKKFNYMNYCWYLKAVLSTPDVAIKAEAPARAGSRSGVSYNIYRSGVLIDNVSEPMAVIDNPVNGEYYVTAVNGDNESGESNVVSFTGCSGISETTYDTAVYYDRASSAIVAGQESSFEVYSMSGMLVASGYGQILSVADLQPGAYTVKVSDGNTVSIVKIVR